MIKRWIEYSGEADGAGEGVWCRSQRSTACLRACFLPSVRHPHSPARSTRRLVLPFLPPPPPFAGGLVPPVWNSWLRGTRHHPPTPEELQHFAAQRENLRVNVEKLKVEERKRALLVKAEASRKKEQDSTVSEISR